MRDYRLATFMVIISLLSFTIYYIMRVTTIAAPCEGIQAKHVFMSHVNVAFIALLLPTLAKRVRND